MAFKDKRKYHSARKIPPGGKRPSVVDGLVADDVIFSSTVEAFSAMVFGLAEASFGAKLNGVGVGAVPAEIMFHLRCRLLRFLVPLLKFVYKHLTSFLLLLC